MLLYDSGKDKTKETIKGFVITMREAGEARGGGKMNK